jgi:hypothetical protein
MTTIGTRARIALAATAAVGLLALTMLAIAAAAPAANGAPAPEGSVGKARSGTYRGFFGIKHGGNMKLTVSSNGTVESFEFSKALVACHGGIYHTVKYTIGVHKPIRNRIFRFRAHDSHGGHAKAGGVFRGSNKAFGYLRLKGVIKTTHGYRSGCNSGRLPWGAKNG